MHNSMLQRNLALFSIHDVMPSTMADVRALIELCRQNGVENLTLLVVPGCNWQPADLEQLRAWQSEGCDLAGHGWVHRCRSIRGLKHRVHSLLISRDVAEHLSLVEAEIIGLMQDCARWFDVHGFGCPQLYVPPAWALGRVRRSSLSTLPFGIVETLWGVQIVKESMQRPIPLLGFEADTVLRKWSLRAINRVNRLAASAQTMPIRVAIHPPDHRLRLCEDLKSILNLGWRGISYRALSNLQAT